MLAGYFKAGGSPSVMQRLAFNLTKKGHNVTLGALRFKTYPCSTPYDWVVLPRNIANLKRFLESFDIIHNHHPLTNYLSLLSSKPFIYHYHGSPTLLLRYNMFFSFLTAGQNIDLAIAISDTAKSELQNFYPFKKIFTIYNGVDTSEFRLRLQGKYRKGNPQFLFVGNLYPHKNVKHLLLAMRKIVKDCPNSHLMIVGTGKMLSTLQPLIANLSLTKHVQLTGKIPDSELPEYYSSCDVYISASKWELFGLPLLEAMACGKPIVASSIPAHIELLTKSGAGQIYQLGNISDLAEKMITVSRNSFSYQQLCRRFAEQYDWSVVTQQVINLYDDLIN